MNMEVRAGHQETGLKRARFLGKCCCAAVLVWLAACPLAQGITVTRTSDAVLYIDTSANVLCSYASYQIINNDGVNYSNLWVKIDSFSGGVVNLGGGDPGQYNLGTLLNNQTNTVFFYLAATGTTASAQSHAVSVYRGTPVAGVLLTNQSFSLTVSSSGQNNSQTVTAVSVAPNPPVVGAIFTVNVSGNTGTIGGVNRVNFTPSVFTNWNAAAYQLVGAYVSASGGNTGNYSNTLVVAFGSQTATAYTNTYYFRAVAVVPTNSVSPLSIQSGGGGNFSHAPPPALGVIPAIQPATNKTVVANFAGVAQLYTNETVTYTIRFTNSSTSAVLLDSVSDTLPAGFNLIANSSSFEGVAILNPAVSGQTLTWSERYSVSAGGSSDLKFQAVPVTSGYGTNAAVGYAQSTIIDATPPTGDNSPALSVVRVLVAPTATNDSGATLEDAQLGVSAPGVLANDNEPNGFALSVAGYTQPAHGSLTMGADGSYVYLPVPNYFGSDSFTYILTNGNARSAVATVNLTVSPVNDAPTLNSITNLTINEDAGQQTVNLSGMTAGPANESGQVLTVTATSSTPGLIPNPVVTYTSPNSTGTLQFTPAATSNGVATIYVVVHDDGGTANGGVDAVTNSFVVTVNPVNHAPSFAKGSNPGVLENSGAATLAGWATGISAGPPNESSQAVTFHVSNDNNPLFATQPAISTGGVLTFIPATNATGSATVSVYLQDNGGTANGGTDTSATQTFTITVVPVNQAPALSPISNVTINEDAGQQTVNLSGITAGPANETGQALTVTATSGNPGLIPNPVVTYTSPNPTGTLQFAPAATSNGVATIYVVVHDDGGTANGGVATATNTFTVTVQAVSTTWPGGMSLTNTVSDAQGAPDAGYSQLNLTGNLDIQADSNHPVVEHLVSLAGTNPGLAAGFDYHTNYTWTIVTTTRGITGFNPASFQIDTTGFSNDLAGGTFSAVLSPDSKAINLVFTPNHAPVVVAANFGRPWGTSFQLAVSALLGSASDPDGDTLSLVSVTSTNGTVATIDGGTVNLTFVNNLNENLTCTVRDTRNYRPGDTVQTGASTFALSVTNTVSAATGITRVGNGFAVGFSGVPGYGYNVERSTDLKAWDWIVLATTNAPAGGTWEFIDGNPPQNAAFYRARQQ